jgi:excisionase family DNA binding protein
MRDTAHNEVVGLLTTEQAAPLVGLSPAHLRRLCAEGKVRGAQKLGKTWLVAESSLRQVARQRAPKEL